MPAYPRARNVAFFSFANADSSSGVLPSMNISSTSGTLPRSLVCSMNPSPPLTSFRMAPVASNGVAFGLDGAATVSEAGAMIHTSEGTRGSVMFRIAVAPGCNASRLPRRSRYAAFRHDASAHWLRTVFSHCA